MVQEFLDPNSNVNTLWDVYNYLGRIDDGVRQPSLPPNGGTQRVSAAEGDDFEEQAYGMTNPVGSYDEITSIVVWVYGNYVDTASPGCRIKVGGVYETEQPSGIALGGYAWHSITFNGSWTQTEVNSLEISFNTFSMGKTGQIVIPGAYVQITGTEAVTGTNMQINIGDSFRTVDALKINIGDSWKTVVSVKQNIGDSWKDVF